MSEVRMPSFGKWRRAKQVEKFKKYGMDRNTYEMNGGIDFNMLTNEQLNEYINNGKIS